MTKKPFVLSTQQRQCLEGCRTYTHYRFMRKQFETHVCPLCHINEEAYSVLYKNTHWVILECMLSQRPHCKRSLLIVPKLHGIELSSISLYASVDLLKAFHWISNQFAGDLKDGGILYSRLGNPDHNIDTVPGHFHFNIAIPDGKGEVRIPVFKDEKRRKENKARAAGFASKYESEELAS